MPDATVKGVAFFICDVLRVRATLERNALALRQNLKEKS